MITTCHACYKKISPNQLGFTLIELMIVIAIIGILYTVALPSYQTFMQDGRRVDAQHYALQQVAIIERQYTREGAYRDVGADAAEFTIAASDYYSFTYSPANSVAAATGPVPTASATGGFNDKFTITITPKKGSQSSDKCGVMTINHQGETTATPAKLAAECWS